MKGDAGGKTTDFADCTDHRHADPAAAAIDRAIAQLAADPSRDFSVELLPDLRPGARRVAVASRQYGAALVTAPDEHWSPTATLELMLMDFKGDVQ